MRHIEILTLHLLSHLVESRCTIADSVKRRTLHSNLIDRDLQPGNFLSPPVAFRSWIPP